MGTIYKTIMNRPNSGRKIEQVHSSDEIIHHANEILAQQMGLDLHFFAGLNEVLMRDGDGDWIYYVDDSGRRVEFTEELQLKAAIAVLNTNGHYFEAIPVEETRSGFA